MNNCNLSSTDIKNEEECPTIEETTPEIDQSTVQVLEVQPECLFEQAPSNNEPKEITLADCHPQQNIFTFENIVISSQFDSGNLARCVNVSKNQFNMYISEDALPYLEKAGNYRTWFYYSVTGVKKAETLTFSIRNMNNQAKLYKHGLKPVYRLKQQNETMTKWKRIPTGVTYDYGAEGFYVTFSHQFNVDSTDTLYFAFTYPYSFEESLRKTQKLAKKLHNHQSIYFHREVLSYSCENREMELLTLTSKQGITDIRENPIQGLFPLHDAEGSEDQKRPFKFVDKQIVFLSSRVHPGETPASYVLNGIIDFLTNEKSEQAQILLDSFVFKIIPMLNPDGVYRGYFRLDTKAQNLNRYYTNPTQQDQPTIWAAKQAILQQHYGGKMLVYADIHAHASKMGCFMFGNCLSGESQLQNMLLPKLISMNCLNFDFIECGFSEKMMNVKDKKDGLSREGCGRVAIHKETELPHCYTLECNYASGRRINHLPPKFNKTSGTTEPEATQVTDMHSRMYTKNKAPNYNIEIFEDVGRAFCIGLLDYIDKNPISRINMSIYKTLDNIKNDILAHYPIIIPKKQQQQDTKIADLKLFQRSNTCKNSKQGSRSSINMLKPKNVGDIKTTGNNTINMSKIKNEVEDKENQKKSDDQIQNNQNFNIQDSKKLQQAQAFASQIKADRVQVAEQTQSNKVEAVSSSQSKLVRNISEKKNRIGYTISQKRNQTLLVNSNYEGIKDTGNADELLKDMKEMTDLYQMVVSSENNNYKRENQLLIKDENDSQLVIVKNNEQKHYGKPPSRSNFKGSSSRQTMISAVDIQYQKKTQFVQLLSGGNSGATNNSQSNGQHYQTEVKQQVKPITVFRMPTPPSAHPNQKSYAGVTYSSTNVQQRIATNPNESSLYKDYVQRPSVGLNINNQQNPVSQVLENQFTQLLDTGASAQINNSGIGVGHTLLGSQYFSRRGGSKEHYKPQQRQGSNRQQRISSENSAVVKRITASQQLIQQQQQLGSNQIAKNRFHQNIVSPKFVREQFLQRSQHINALNRVCDLAVAPTSNHVIKQIDVMNQ